MSDFEGLSYEQCHEFNALLQATYNAGITKQGIINPERFDVKALVGEMSTWVYDKQDPILTEANLPYLKGTVYYPGGSSIPLMLDLSVNTVDMTSQSRLYQRTSTRYASLNPYIPKPFGFDSRKARAARAKQEQAVLDELNDNLVGAPEGAEERRKFREELRTKPDMTRTITTDDLEMVRFIIGQIVEL